jgi:YqaJ-like viral recombinase domain.
LNLNRDEFDKRGIARKPLCSKVKKTYDPLVTCSKPPLSGFIVTNPKIPALKYGRDMEIHTVGKFVDEFGKKHLNLNCKECGSFLYGPHPFLEASPDRMVSCSCHGLACLEIKCLYSSHTSPLKGNHEYLKKSPDGALYLNRNPTYYTQ